MRRPKSAFFDFVRAVVNCDIDEVSRRLAADPALATARAEVGATRQGATVQCSMPSIEIYRDIATGQEVGARFRECRAIPAG